MSMTAANVGDGRWRAEPALTLECGPTRAMFLPGLGMTGVSLRHRGREYLATPGGPAALRAGHTLGLPLLAPWANRLGSREFQVADVDVDLRRRRLHTDGNGLLIHGFLVGARSWEIVGTDAGRTGSRLDARILVDRPGFPFPHRLVVRAVVRPARLDVTTTIVPTASRAVPVAFGWHPYLRVPGSPRGRWRLRLPAREHLVLDARGLPTGERRRVSRETSVIGRRTFDDLYALGARRALTLESDDASVTVRGDRRYPFAQVWVPPGRSFAALEPMTVATNALATGAVPVVEPGDAFSASFSVELR